MVTVVALVHGKRGAYGISFPDFPGCVSGGASLDEALRRGRAALAEDFEDAAVVTAVDLDLPGRPVRLNVSLDERLVRSIDQRARELGETRSGFLAAAARTRLAG